jgi:HCOMODA/2-hydroxy-3-carboxy-muconic semialdehyde decarboxylase
MALSERWFHPMSDMDSVAFSSPRRLRMAARAVAGAALVHAYGHCSLRISAESFLVTPAKPLGLVLPSDAPIEVRLEGSLPPGTLGEVLAHQQIYQRRPDVKGIVRFQSPSVTTLSTLGQTPRARHGFGAYFAPSPPLYRNPRLVRDVPSAQTLASELGSSRAIVMRGNGAIAVGTSIEEAVVMAWYLEDAARVELAVLAAGGQGLELSEGEARDRAVISGRIIERMWEWLTARDPEGTSDPDGGNA